MAVGEADYIIRWRETGLNRSPGCQRCSEGCPVWTRSVRERHWVDDNFYGEVRKLFPHHGQLIYSIKYTQIYDRLGWPDVPVLIFRRPDAMAISTAHHNGAASAAFYDMYIRYYGAALDTCKARGPIIAVSYEDFVEDYQWQTRELCELIGLTPPDVVPTDTRDFTDHQLAGNMGMRAESRGGQITPDKRYETETVLAPSARAWELHRMMLDVAVRRSR